MPIPWQLALPPPGFEFPSRSARHNPPGPGSNAGLSPGETSPDGHPQGTLPAPSSDPALSHFIMNARAELAQKRRELQERDAHAMGEMQM